MINLTTHYNAVYVRAIQALQAHENHLLSLLKESNFDEIDGFSVEGVDINLVDTAAIINFCASVPAIEAYSLLAKIKQENPEVHNSLKKDIALGYKNNVACRVLFDREERLNSILQLMRCANPENETFLR